MAPYVVSRSLESSAFAAPPPGGAFMPLRHPSPDDLFVVQSPEYEAVESIRFSVST
jgi:hypothetical protein